MDSGRLRQALGPMRRALQRRLEQLPKFLHEFANNDEFEAYRQQIELCRAQMVASKDDLHYQYNLLLAATVVIGTEDSHNTFVTETQTILAHAQDALATLTVEIGRLNRLEQHQQEQRRLDMELELRLEHLRQQAAAAPANPDPAIQATQIAQAVHIALQSLPAFQAHTQPCLAPAGAPPNAGPPPQQFVKLPKIEPVKFNGDVSRWQEFWDFYLEAIHNRSDLTNVRKFNYLRAYVTGEAFKAIDGIAVTNDNYQGAIDILAARFNDVQLAVNTHMAALNSLPSCTSQTAKLRAFTDSVERHLRQLEAAGQNIDHPAILTMLQAKLPPDVLLQMLRMNVNGARIQTVVAFRQLLLRYVSDAEAIEALAKPVIKSVSESANSYLHNELPTVASKSNLKPTTGVLLVGAKATSSRSGTAHHTLCCIYCKTKDQHRPSDCPKYRTIEERKRQLLPSTCFNCLGPKHCATECRSKGKCVFCHKQGHHSSLCPSQFGTVSPVTRCPTTATSKSSTAATSSLQTKTNSSTVMVTTVSPSASTALLTTGDAVNLRKATATVCSRQNENGFPARLVFDTGAQRTYITEALAKRLCLKPIRTDYFDANMFTGVPVATIKSHAVEFRIRLLDGNYFRVIANTLQKICNPIERMPYTERISPLILSQLADTLPTKVENVGVDILIGDDYFDDFILPNRIELSKSLRAHESTLGWVLAGRHKSNTFSKCDPTSLLVSTCLVNDFELSFAPDRQLAQHGNERTMWDLETLGICEPLEATDDEEALRQFTETIEFKDGRYYVTFPWKDTDPKLPTNYQLALGRLQSLVKRHRNDPEFFIKYNAIIQGQLEKGIIEQVRESNTAHQHKLHYIPHHAVITPDKETTKVRIVYDGSAKTCKSNVSLNECILRGPVLLENLCGLLMRFRLNTIAIVADIEKAFLQVGLHECDRDVTRFLWLRDPTRMTTEHNLQTYRFCRIPFGINASPFLLECTNRHHLKRIGTQTATKIAHNIYVDNVIVGAANDKEGYRLYSEAKEIFNAASMNLRQWATNSAELRQRFAAPDRVQSTNLKILGVKWDTISDTMCIVGPTDCNSDAITKRTLLKTVASFFDPLGLFSPILLPLKVLFQRCWTECLDWDDPLPETLLAEWTTISQQCFQLSELSFPRHIGTISTELPVHELHVFCDASSKAYAATAFLRTICTGFAKANLVFAKTRLTPVRSSKTLTIPRLELLAVFIGCKLLSFIEKHLMLKIERRVLWTDSKCVLAWLRSPHSLKRFEENRVKTIRATDSEFRYVNTAENPADIASRGAITNDLRANTLWWKGPSWLQDTNEANWPVAPEYNTTTDQTLLTVFYSTSLMAESAAVVTAEEKLPFNIKITDYSSLQRLLRVTAWANRFIKNCKSKEKIKSENLTFQEIEEAKLLWICHEQQQQFSTVFESIENKKREPMKDSLGVWRDETGVLRCGGRLGKADLSFSAIKPILLSAKSALTKLIVWDIHHHLFHQGVSHTLARVRSQYWIPSGRRVVYNLLRSRVNCKRFDGGPYQLPPMPDLPKDRVSPSPAFTSTGLDFFGPLYVRSTADTQLKAWVCLFTCLATRALHLELVDDLSAEQFLLSLKRFVSRRGTPKVVFSDNAPTFKIVNTTLQTLWRRVIWDDSVTAYCSFNGIEWHFITEYAPWQGGFYERLVRLVKQSLKKSIGKVCLTRIQLETILIEIEAILNTRPLTYVNADLKSNSIITPAHFLSLNPKIAFDPPNTPTDFSLSTRNELLDSWKRGQQHLNAFWKCWRSDYLLALRERTLTRVRQPRIKYWLPPKPGDIVLVKAETPRATWRLARLESLNYSTDGQIRTAQIAFSNGNRSNRSIAHLYPLEVTEAEKPYEVGTTNSGEDKDEDRNLVPEEE